MKKLTYISFLFIWFGAKAQYPQGVFIKPNNSFGTQMNRLDPDSTLYLPTGCGVPTDSTWLFSQGTSLIYPGYGQKLKKAAKYYDSCGHHEYTWDPSLLRWHISDSSGGGGGSPNTSVGGAVAVAITGTNNVKSLDTAWGTKLDSSHTNIVKIGVDSNSAASKNYVNKIRDSLGANKLSAISTTNSVVGNGTPGSPVQLAGDASAPGNSQYYGTNGSGAKGYYSLPSGVAGANPTASIGLAPVNGTASTFLRSDAAPALAQQPDSTVIGNGTSGTATPTYLTIPALIGLLDTLHRIPTVTALKDSAYGVLNQQSMVSIIEFIQTGDSTTYTSSSLIGHKIIQINSGDYLVPSLNNGGVYYTFNAATGQITLTAGHFSNGDFVHIEYRNTPIFLTDGSGNYIKDSNGNYIITN